MAYLTITYNQNDAPILLSTIKNLQTHFTEIPTKKCVSIIPGLISCSFKFPTIMHANTIQSLFDSEY